MANEITDQKEQNTPGYQDFITYYDKLEKLRKGKSLDSHLFIYYVTYCSKYIQSLDPYEYQIVVSTMPSMEEKMETVISLYAKVKSAIFETLNEIAQKTDKQSVSVQSDTSKK